MAPHEYLNTVQSLLMGAPGYVVAMFGVYRAVAFPLLMGVLDVKDLAAVLICHDLRYSYLFLLLL